MVFNLYNTVVIISQQIITFNKYLVHYDVTSRHWALILAVEHLTVSRIKRTKRQFICLLMATCND